MSVKEFFVVIRSAQEIRLSFGFGKEVLYENLFKPLWFLSIGHSQVPTKV